MPDRSRQALESCAHELFERSRDRQRLPRTQRRFALQQETGDLERVKGIPARSVVHTAERGARQRLAKARDNEPVLVTDSERPHPDPKEPVGQRTLELEPRRPRLQPDRDE